jgi:hypothetical protein
VFLRQSVIINRSGHWDQQAWPVAKVIPEQVTVTVWGKNINYKKNETQPLKLQRIQGRFPEVPIYKQLNIKF